MQTLNRSKGRAGAQKMQAQRGLMARAEDQAAQLWAAMHARSPTPAIRTEEDIMRLARDKGLIMSGGGEGEKSQVRLTPRQARWRKSRQPPHRRTAVQQRP